MIFMVYIFLETIFGKILLMLKFIDDNSIFILYESSWRINFNQVLEEVCLSKLKAYIVDDGALTLRTGMN